jgi:hypothetical protein
VLSDPCTWTPAYLVYPTGYSKYIYIYIYIYISRETRRCPAVQTTNRERTEFNAALYSTGVLADRPTLTQVNISVSAAIGLSGYGGAGQLSVCVAEGPTSIPGAGTANQAVHPSGVG